MKDSIHTLLFAITLGLICATALTGADRFTAERKQANKEAEEIRNILGVLGIDFDPKAPSKELVEIFEKNIQEETSGELKRYVYRPGGADARPQAVAVRFAGPGLWGPVRGFLSLDADMRTIAGVTFYEQEETPGLGGEIATEAFTSQFIGKSITDPSGQPGIRIRRGGGQGPNEVDGITGATMTCEKVEAMLNATIEIIVQEREKSGQ